MFNEFDKVMGTLRAKYCLNHEVNHEAIIKKAELLFERIVYSAKLAFGNNVRYDVLPEIINGRTAPTIQIYPVHDGYFIMVMMWGYLENEGRCADKIEPEIIVWPTNPNSPGGWIAGEITVTENEYKLKRKKLSIGFGKECEIEIRNDRKRLKRFFDLITVWCNDGVWSTTMTNVHSMFEIPQEYIDYRRTIADTTVCLLTELDNCIRSFLKHNLIKIVNGDDEESDLIQYYFADKNKNMNIISIGTDARCECGDISDPEPNIAVSLYISEYRYDKFWETYGTHPMISSCYWIHDKQIQFDGWSNISDSCGDNLSDEELMTRYGELIDTIDSIKIYGMEVKEK